MKILFVVPHLSTGGMPQYTYWLIKEILNNRKCEIYLVEYSMTAKNFTIQRDKIKELIGSNFITLSHNEDKKEEQLFDVIKNVDPDAVHLQEIPELWLKESISKRLYSKDRLYKIVETSHDSGFDPKNKRFLPDSFAFVSRFHPKIYSDLNVPYKIVEYPITKHKRPNRDEAIEDLGLSPKYKHVLNVGLFTPRKNQAEIFKMARKMIDYKILFHFIGNQADNFYKYWSPLMNNLPPNCIVWRERSDIDRFYSCMDLFLFTSKGSKIDRETNPLVIKEALGWGMPVFIYNLDVYMGMYEGNSQITFLKDDIQENCNMILNFLGFRKEKRLIYVVEDNKIDNSDHESLSLSIEAARRLELPISLLCSNEKWLNKYKENCDYEKLSIIKKSKNRDDLKIEYNNHDIFLSPCEEDSNLYVLSIAEPLSYGLPCVVFTRRDIESEGIEFVDKDINNIVYGIKRIVENYDDYSFKARKFIKD